MFGLSEDYSIDYFKSNWYFISDTGKISYFNNIPDQDGPAAVFEGRDFTMDMLKKFKSYNIKWSIWDNKIDLYKNTKI